VGNGGEAGVFESIGIIKGIVVGLRPCRNQSGEVFTISFQDFSTVLDFKIFNFYIALVPMQK
jgi:hypothetical protein